MPFLCLGQKLNEKKKKKETKRREKKRREREREAEVVLNKKTFTHESTAMIFTADSQSIVVLGHHKSILPFLSSVVSFC